MSKAIERFKECDGSDEKSPLERLRFFCSLAMSGDDWLDVESFFIDVEKQLADSVPKSEIEHVFDTPRESECPYDSPTCEAWYNGYRACISEFEKLLNTESK